jgi:hypothetical protein
MQKPAKTCKKSQTGESGRAIREIQNVVSEGNVKKYWCKMVREGLTVGGRKMLV